MIHVMHTLWVLSCGRAAMAGADVGLKQGVVDQGSLQSAEVLGNLSICVCTY